MRCSPLEVPVYRQRFRQATSPAARNADQVVSLVCAHTIPGSLYYADDWQAYASLRVQGDHIVVRKEKGRPRGRDHINGIEG